MPHYETCGRCSFEYHEKTGRWSDDARFKAIYRKDIQVDDVDYADLRARLSKFWYQSGGGVSRFKACERCYKHDPEIAGLMDHVPDGWMALSKGEVIAKEVEKSCVLM